MRAARGLCLLLLTIILLPVPARSDGLIDTLVQRFAHSDFEFMRASSNAPFPPVAALTLNTYQDAQFRRSDTDTSTATAHQSTASQYAFLPIPIGQRDALAIGEWISWTHFDLDNAARNDLDVLSVSIPIGWVRQSSPDWQIAAFVSPYGSTTPDDDWYWETLGGAFARNMRGDRFAWIVGVYFDVGPLEDFYTPYLGATYIIDERWTLNAIMPWPSITYAPTPETLFRLGISPSGASWSVEAGESRPRVDLDAWNLGVAVEHRLFSNVWVGIEAGASCLRGLAIVGGEWQSPDTKLSGTGYALLTFNMRPGSMRHGQ